MKNGINCDLRELQVGDLLWLAREKPEYSQSKTLYYICLKKLLLFMKNVLLKGACIT